MQRHKSSSAMLQYQTKVPGVRSLRTWNFPEFGLSIFELTRTYLYHSPGRGGHGWGESWPEGHGWGGGHSASTRDLLGTCLQEITSTSIIHVNSRNEIGFLNLPRFVPSLLKPKKREWSDQIVVPIVDIFAVRWIVNRKCIVWPHVVIQMSQTWWRWVVVITLISL